MDRATIRQRVVKALRDDDSNIGWTVDELNRYIEDGYKELAALTKAIVDTRDIYVGPDEHFLTLPDDCVQVFETKDKDTEYPIDQVHWDFIDSRDWVWIRNSASRPWLIAPWALHEAIIYPAYAAGGTVTMTMAILPGALADVDEPDIPDEYHRSLIFYATWRAVMRGVTSQERMERAMYHFRRYSQSLGGLDEWTDKRMGDFYRFAVGVGPNLRRPLDIQKDAW